MFVFGFVFGAMMGSVANAVIYRLPKQISWVHGRSMCPHCKHELQFIDLIPLLSYVSLGGTCRYCHKAIGRRYFAVELCMAIVFSLIFNFKFEIFNQFSILQALLLAALVWVTVVIAMTDWETQLVSDLFVIFWAVLAFVQRFMNHDLGFMSIATGVGVGVGLIGGIWLLTRGRGMGLGDVEIAAAMGLWLGWPRVAYALWLAFVLGATWGVWLLARKRGKLKSEVPFGPFLVLGSWLAWLVPLGWHLL